MIAVRISNDAHLVDTSSSRGHLALCCNYEIAKTYLGFMQCCTTVSDSAFKRE